MLPLESQLRLAIDTIPGLVWTARPDGHIDFLNQRWLDYTGLTLDEASGWGWQRAVHPTDFPGLLHYWKSVLAAGTPGETEARLRSVDGEYRWFLFRGVPLYDEEGRLVKWYGQTTDIEDRKRAEALLTGEKRLLEMVARGRPLGEILTALCTFVEATAPGCHCSILQYDSDKRRLHSIAAPSLPASYTDFVDGIGGTCGGPCGMAAQMNEQIIAADIESDARWDTSGWRALALAHQLRACWSTPIRSFEGNVLGTFAVSFTEPGQPTEYHKSLIDQFTDLASIAIERSRKEEKLRRSEAYLAEAQRLSQTGSFSWRPATGDIVWSEQTYRIYELDPSIKPTIELARARVHPEDVLAFEQAVARAMAGDDLSFEHRLLLPNGDIKFLHVVARAERGVDGEPTEFVGAVRDVTDLKGREAALHRVRAELAHVSRVATVGALTASIAHEVNQPLSGIVTNASVCMRALAAQPPEIQAASEAAKRAIRDANRAAEVITRLRALFRKKNVAREPFDLNDAIHEVLALATSEIQRSKAAVRTALADELPSVLGDRTQVQQVVLNLVLNSLEAMHGVEVGRRTLVIETRIDAGNVRIEVCDAGTGLDAQNVERVFDPFFTTKSGGMGMGLSISRSIIESHQGRLWAVHGGGVGATFAFTLPLASAE